jgi:non-reducing end alpha-L-arabinofuranosidase
MHEEADILFGTGGDNSNGATGEFFEGAVTSGYPSDATENAVQAGLATAGYAATSADRPDRGQRQRCQVHGRQRLLLR